MSTPGNALPEVVFFGTPEFAATIFQALLDSRICRIAAVVCQPDKPQGRGRELSLLPVKKLALEAGIPVLQPVALKGMTVSTDSSGRKKIAPGKKSQAVFCDTLNSIENLKIFVVVAYGRILPKEIIDFPPLGSVNIHSSVLPRWRGAAPMHRAIFAGDPTTGISLMNLEETMDTGPIYAETHTPIASDETFGSLHDRLAILGAELLINTLPGIISGTVKPIPQRTEGVTHAEKWERDDCRIHWEESAAVTDRRVRTSSPFPGAKAVLNGEEVKVFSTKVVADQTLPKKPAGTIVEMHKTEIIVACGTSEYISIGEMQFPGKKRLSVRDLLNGKKLTLGQVFS